MTLVFARHPEVVWSRSVCHNVDTLEQAKANTAKTINPIITLRETPES